MEILMINASPRAPISHSKEYARMLAQQFLSNQEITVKHTIALGEKRIEESAACTQSADYVVLVFPLYVDSVPVTVLSLFSCLERLYAAKKAKFVMHVVVNCGFLEAYQNDTAVAAVKLFCKQNNIAFGSALCIGSGEAILGTPFRRRVEKALCKLSESIVNGEEETYYVQMPLPKWMFVRAGNRFWQKRGEANGLTYAQMASGEIKGNS